MSGDPNRKWSLFVVSHFLTIFGVFKVKDSKNYTHFDVQLLKTKKSSKIHKVDE